MAGKQRTPSEQTAPDDRLRPAPDWPFDSENLHNGGEPDRPGRVIEIQRARILAAMVEVCGEHGAANGTVTHIVERAGVSRRTFYELFEDREACFLAAFDDAIARASRHALDAYDPSAKWVERVRTALTNLLSFLDAERDIAQLLIVGSLGAGQPALERRRRGIAQIIALVDEGGNESKAGSELPPLTAEGIVGGVLSVLHSRLAQDDPTSLLELTGPLMGMIVLPYLGPAAARKEIARPVPKASVGVRHVERNPLGRLGMRLTYRTVRVLLAVAASPGDSNRAVADRAGIADQGQISKLLSRLEKLGLVSNVGLGAGTGAPNAWTLTEQGEEVNGVLAAGS